jgi:hypothetical protein
MPMNLPTLADLQGVYGAGSLTALDQASQNQGLAQQYGQRELQQQQNDVQAGSLRNIYNDQQNPQLLRQQSLQNQGLQNTNAISGVNALRTLANAPMQLSQDQQDFALKASSNDLAQAENHAVKLMQSQDPQQQQEGQHILSFTKAANQARIDQANKMAQIGAMGSSKADVAQIGAGSREAVAQTGASGREAVANIQSQRAIQTKQMSQTLNQKLAYLNTQDQNDPVIRQQTDQVRRDLTTANAAYANAISMPSLQTGTLARQGDQPVPQQNAPVAPRGTPTQAHIQYLQANPQQRANFDKTYGPGAAAKILGQ